MTAASEDEALIDRLNQENDRLQDELNAANLALLSARQGLRFAGEEHAKRYHLWKEREEQDGREILALNRTIAQLESGIHPAKTPMEGGFNLQEFAPGFTQEAADDVHEFLKRRGA